MVTTPSLFDGDFAGDRDETSAPRATALTRPDHPTMGAFTRVNDATSDPSELFSPMLGDYVSHTGSLL